MEKQLYKNSKRRGTPFLQLTLLIMAPLLMGILCVGGGSGSVTPTTGLNIPINKNTMLGSTLASKAVSTTDTIPLLNFSQMKMLDAQNGWATTLNAILKTSDGGRTWIDLTPADWKLSDPQTRSSMTVGTTNSIINATFLDINHAWVVVSQVELTEAEINAANTAIAGAANDPNATINGNLFPKVKSTAYVHSTIDGGHAWMTSNALTIQNMVNTSEPNFVDQHEGWIELIYANITANTYLGDVYHSLDGGVTWTQESTGQIVAKGQLSGMTITPDCVTGTTSTLLPPCPAPVNSTVQGCTVPGTTQYLGLATAAQSQSSTLWLNQKVGNDIWQNLTSVPAPSIAGQTGSSLITASPPIMFNDGTGILPIQLESDPVGQNPGHFFLHLDGVKTTVAGAQIYNLSPTSSFAISVINAQHVLSAPDMQHIFVIGQDYANGTYGDWSLYEFNGTNWIKLTSQIDGTIDAPQAGQQADLFAASLSNLTFISANQGWATNGANVYHIAVENGVATWSQVYPDSTATEQVVVPQQPGRVIPPPTNPPPCVPPPIVATGTGTSGDATASPFLHTFTFVNKTNQTIWVGANGNTPSDKMPDHGTWDGELVAGATMSVTISTPNAIRWSGRFWGRTGCVNSKCESGDCGTAIFCGTGGLTPATLAEFTLNGDGGKDFYDVSLVDGYNLPVLISGSDGGPAPNNCGAKACIDINTVCPGPLQLLNGSGKVVGCKSACAAFGTDQYCCLGAYNPMVCDPNTWPADVDSAKLFKDAYPHAYSYAYDDFTSTYTCKPCNFSIVFGLTNVTATGTGTGTTGGTGSTAEQQAAQAVFQAVNQERKDTGNLPAFQWSSALVQSAHLHNLAMIAANTMSHQLPGEPPIGTRVTNQGLVWSSVAENIGYGGGDPTTAAVGLNLAMYNEQPPGETGHRENILSNNTLIGIDVVVDTQNNKVWITEDFATLF